MPSNDPRKNCGTNFGSNFLLAPKGVGKKNQEERKFELLNAKKKLGHSSEQKITVFIRLTALGAYYIFRS